jgi:hypothetical protein
MQSFCSRSKAKGKSSLAKPGSMRSTKFRKVAPVLLNLNELEDYDNDNDDDSDEGDLLGREWRHFAFLDKKLLTCQRCGPDRFCKIDQTGTHVNLTMGQ